MNKGSIVERFWSDSAKWIAKNRDINHLLYFYFYIQIINSNVELNNTLSLAVK